MDEVGASPAEMGLKPEDLGIQKTPDVKTQTTNQQVTQTENKPSQLLRQISKVQSKEERTQMAQEIKAIRNDFRATRRESTEQQKTLLERKRALEAEKSAYVAEKEARLKDLSTIAETLSELSTNWFTRTLNKSRIEELQNNASETEGVISWLKNVRYAELSENEDKLLAEELKVVTRLERNGRPAEIEETRGMLKDFYAKEKNKWASSEYTKEEMTKYFQADFLKSLSNEDFVLLLSHFPSQMVTHVTRQGIRDHVGGMDHTAGLGDYTTGFMDIADAGELRAAFGIYLKDGVSKESIMRCLNMGGRVPIKNREGALQVLKSILVEGVASGGYADRTAIHLATGEVADFFYGSERGNEIFFAFPSAYIASQHFFAGQLSEENSGNHNDTWVWPDGTEGVPLDAGVVFIPADTKVDRTTGSKYELDSQRRPIERADYIEQTRGLVQSEGFSIFYEEAKTILGDKNAEAALPGLQERLAQEFGITDPRLQSTILEYQNLHTLESTLHAQKEYYGFDAASRRVLRNGGVLYKESQNTVSAQDYWESYFQLHADKLPKRIVYYKGEDPTRALRDWREANGLTKKSPDPNLGFSENLSTERDTRMTSGMDRFKSLALEAIDEYFPEKPKRPSKAKPLAKAA